MKEIIIENRIYVRILRVDTKYADCILQNSNAKGDGVMKEFTLKCKVEATTDNNEALIEALYEIIGENSLIVGVDDKPMFLYLQEVVVMSVDEYNEDE